MKETSIAERIAINEKRYREFTRRLVDSLWVVDAETLNIIFVSDSTQKLRGYSAEEVIGTHINEIMTDDSYRKVLRVLKKACEEYKQGAEPSFRLEIECHHKNGDKVWIEISAKFVKEGKEPLQIIGMSREMPERKIAEINAAQLLKMYKKALGIQKRLIEEANFFEKLLPICSSCKRIRDNDSNWWPLEEYVRRKPRAKVSHTICPECTNMYRFGK